MLNRLSVPNFLSLLRIPFALVFLQENVLLRALAIVLAMLSDSLDGYIARKYRMITPLGRLLDPLMDKFFVFFVLIIFLNEGRLSPWNALTMLCRDFSVILFGFYLAYKGTLSEYQFRSIWCGKIMTSMQFTVLLGLTLHLVFPTYVYISFVVVGLCALIELYLERSKIKIES